MSKKVLLSSPADTPDEDKIYVVEIPEVSRIKFREADIDKEIAQIDWEITKKEERKAELVDIKNEIEKLK